MASVWRGRRRRSRHDSGPSRWPAGGLDAAGLALSPYAWAGRQRWFLEPPHMQSSMLFLPASVPPPAIGDELVVDVRFTTTVFDRVTIG